MRSSPFLVFALIATLAGAAGAETAPGPDGAPASPGSATAAERFDFPTYLREVGRGNLDLAAERSSVAIAEADIAVAHIFPDPQITAGLLQYDVTQKGNPTATIVQLGVPLEIGGQRGARVAFAETNLSAVQSDLEDFLRGLRASAANSYVDSLHARFVLDRRRRTLASLERLVAANEERFRAGDIGQAAVLQSRVEANQFRAEVIDADGIVRSADVALVALLGVRAAGRLGRALSLEGDLRAAADRHFDTNALVKVALSRRPDLIAARRRLAAAGRQIDLAQANRVIGFAVGAAWQHNFAVAGGATLPASDFLGATLTLPLPFSRTYRGEVDAAIATRHQADALARSANVRVEAEVREAIARYDAAAARAKLYAQGVLVDADQVLEKVLYNYQRGGATLVEVLVAQRTDNDVYLSYYDSLADAAHALVAVEQASGTWDVKF